MCIRDSTTTDPYFEELVQADIPCVVIDVPVIGQKAGCISIDNIQASRAVSYTHLDVYKRQTLQRVAVGALALVMTAELQKIGTNINQIAKRVNATGEIYAQDIEDIKGVLNEIWLSQRSILSKAP